MSESKQRRKQYPDLYGTEECPGAKQNPKPSPRRGRWVTGGSYVDKVYQNQQPLNLRRRDAKRALAGRKALLRNWRCKARAELRNLWPRVEALRWLNTPNPALDGELPSRRISSGDWKTVVEVAKRDAEGSK